MPNDNALPIARHLFVCTKIQIYKSEKNNLLLYGLKTFQSKNDFNPIDWIVQSKFWIGKFSI